MEIESSRSKPQHKKGHLSDHAKPTRNCDICEENMMTNHETSFVIIDGIPGKRHKHCVEALNG